MSGVGDAIGDVVGGITGARQAGEAGERAGELQYQASVEGIAEQRRQFDALVELMSPYVQSGNRALSGQEDMLGLNGMAAQQGSISGIENSPLFQELTKQSEDAMLQNASATGGLRGGNIQGALAQFRPQMLQQFIEQQFGRLGGLASMGQASAAGQAASGMQSASSIGDLLAQGGAARAGGALAKGNIVRNTFGDIMSGIGMYAGGKMGGAW